MSHKQDIFVLHLFKVVNFRMLRSLGKTLIDHLTNMSAAKCSAGTKMARAKGNYDKLYSIRMQYKIFSPECFHTHKSSPIPELLHCQQLKIQFFSNLIVLSTGSILLTLTEKYFTIDFFSHRKIWLGVLHSSVIRRSIKTDFIQLILLHKSFLLIYFFPTFFFYKFFFKYLKELFPCHAR